MVEKFQASWDSSVVPGRFEKFHMNCERPTGTVACIIGVASSPKKLPPRPAIWKAPLIGLTGAPPVRAFVETLKPAEMPCHVLTVRKTVPAWPPTQNVAALHGSDHHDCAADADCPVQAVTYPPMAS
jgi:hypothetical protein